ncbi:MAG: hypothetical protein EA370_16755, partial [Wenzhouxiangella sp.]
MPVLPGLARVSRGKPMNAIQKLIATLVALGWLSIVASPVSAEMDSRQIWTGSGGEVRLELRADYLPDFGLEIVHRGEQTAQVLTIERAFSELDHLVIEAPYGNFEHLSAGAVRLDTDLVLRHGRREVALAGLVLTPGLFVNNHPSLEARDAAGRHLLTFHHMHILADPEQGSLSLHNVGFSATAVLSELLDLPALEGVDLGMAWFDLHLSVPF